MNISSAFPSNYIKAADLQGKRVTVKMAGVKIEKLGQDEKPVLYFQGKNKGMVLNKTNAKKIMSAYGIDTQGWAGKEIVLFEAQVEFQGDTVPAIRVAIPAKPAAQQQAPPPHDTFPDEQQDYGDMGNDPLNDVPFA